MGINPAKSYGNYTLYHSPFREEKTPSFKVSHAENLWVDYGDGNSGGSLIDLVLRMHPGLTVSKAIKEIEHTTQPSFSFHRPTSHESKGSKNDNKIHIHKTMELGHNPAVTNYLNSRGIQMETAKPFCKEVYFNMGTKHYFGLGNLNNSGWSIRNKYWKGCSAQGYSYYQKAPKIHEMLSVFEGIFDLLSYVEMDQRRTKAEDYLVLNSLANLNNAHPILEQYETVSMFLDHDMAGRKATDQILQVLSHAQDASGFYKSCNDLNEFLVQSVNVKKNVGTKASRWSEASHILVRPKRLLR